MADESLFNSCYVLVTGANSGLGFAICCRLIDEFLHTRPQSQTLTLIITTRDQRKSDDTVLRLRKHLRTLLHNAEKRPPGASKSLEPRIRFQQEILNLTSLLSVQDAAKRIRASTPKVDAIILNAGIGGWTGIKWREAFYRLFTDWTYAVTFPAYKISGVGWVTRPQLTSADTDIKQDTHTGSEVVTANGTPSGRGDPPLGEIFCANVFGHYLLTHHLSPLLSSPTSNEGAGGRIIWLSTLEAYARTFSTSDLQGLESSFPYESSKRLTDILVLTSALPSTAPWVNRFYGVPPTHSEHEDNTGKRVEPKQYLSHPGVCATSIITLPWLMVYMMILAMYVARWLGSPWHTCRAYLGATAPVWLALASQETLDEMESEKRGKGKWGSATDWRGRERVMRTEVEGWGYGGLVGGVEEVGRETKKGRVRGVEGLNREARERFEELGRKCWRSMEELREEWERRLDRKVGTVEAEVRDGQ